MEDVVNPHLPFSNFRFLKMKINLMTILLLISAVLSTAQVDKEKLALDVSKAETENAAKLSSFIWKKKTDVKVNGDVKLTTLTEFSFDEQGKIQTKMIDADSDVKQKPGIRGKVQQNAAGQKLEYVGSALELSLAYTFMSKGDLIDFFDKATITDKGENFEVIGTNVKMQGDKLVVWVDKKTNLIVYRQFAGLLGKDPVSGEMKYEKFSSGVVHGTTSTLNLPAQNAVLESVNQDYSQRVK